jgi:hypothetical protein
MRNDDIPIHPERGLDPHLLVCQRCGESTGVTVGELRKAQMKKPGDKKPTWLYAPRSQTRKAEAEAEADGYRVGAWIAVQEAERVPDPFPCQSCAAELQMFEAIVAAGGVHFRCATCHFTGVLRGESPYAQAVRRSAGIEAPEPCGVEFENCADHTPSTEGNDNAKE